jgi:signal transduction histidine kinase/ActR/RegA family two-component response regulator
MTKPPQEVARRDPFSLVLYDIAQVLESAEDSEARVIHVLERLRSLVPYERCALLEVLPGSQPRLITPPHTPVTEHAGLMATISALRQRMLEEYAQASDVATKPKTHLAVPLVGLSEVIGVLFVQRTDGNYRERHVRRLSVVAAKLASYLSLLHADTLAAERARELEVARQAAEAANRTKDEFLALVSHELRTPLNAILGWAETLRSKETGEPERTRAFKGIERSVCAQAKLIEDILDLSCVAKAKLRLELRAVEPAKLIKEAIVTLAPRAQQKSIRLEASLDESIAPLIADPQRLSQIIANLIANAIKFTPRGGHVDVHLERAGGFARIRVIDTGMGIAPDVLPNLFEHFHQADTSTTRVHGGLGVGLALVKDLVQLHGGNVRAESPGQQKGATFTVELPLADAASETWPKSARHSAKGGALAGIRVLLVDDDQDIRDVLQFVLEAQGAVVTVAASVAEALAALERSMPHVLLSDIAMPVETGYDLMRQVRARQGTAPPAAAISTYARQRDVQDALASGYRVLLAKPVNPDALIAAVAALASEAGASTQRGLGEGCP